MATTQAPLNRRSPHAVRAMAFLAFVARTAFGAIAGAVGGTVLSAIVAALAALVMMIRHKSVSSDDLAMAVVLTAMIGITFGWAPGAVSGAATLASRRLVASLAGAIPSAVIYCTQVKLTNPGFASVAALSSLTGAVLTAAALHFARRYVAKPI